MSAPQPVSFGAALRFWLQLGFVSFGGPAGQIAIMHRELVERRRWISEGRFLHALNYCMLLPGPEAQQLATYIGWLLHRTWGGVAAGVLFVLPSLAILIALSWVYLRFGHVPVVEGLFYGMKSAVAAIVVQALWRLGAKVLRNPLQAPVPWALAAMSFVAVAWLRLPFPWLVLAAALVGLWCSRYAPRQFAPAAQVHHGAAPSAPALIDDGTPPPAHARFSPRRLAAVLVTGALLWALPMLALLQLHPALAQMGGFFTQAALVTFGGAYAVLPYVVQNAVEHYQWLSMPQMIDGLALGETTPGPLIMVVAFVGFVGGWTHRVLGPDALFLGAALAACVATWFTFLPSFLFILAGGPLVEATHGQARFTAPLAAIGAAVIGAIGSLALFFVANIALRTGTTGSFLAKVDFPALLLAAAAALALLRWRMGVIPVIAACAVGGLALRLAGWR